MPLLAGRGGGGDIAGLLPLQLGDCPQGDLQLREDPAGTLPRRQPDRGAAQSETPKQEGSRLMEKFSAHIFYGSPFDSMSNRRACKIAVDQTSAYVAC